jgi:hypothetical protein
MKSELLQISEALDDLIESIENYTEKVKEINIKFRTGERLRQEDD